MKDSILVSVSYTLTASPHSFQWVCLQGVVISFFRFAEFIEEENDSLQAQDKDNSSNEAGCVEGRLALRLWGWGQGGIGCTCYDSKTKNPQ